MRRAYATHFITLDFFNCFISLVTYVSFAGGRVGESIRYGNMLGTSIANKNLKSTTKPIAFWQNAFFFGILVNLCISKTTIKSLHRL